MFNYIIFYNCMKNVFQFPHISEKFEFLVKSAIFAITVAINIYLILYSTSQGRSN